MNEVSQDNIDPQTFEPTTEAEKFAFDLGFEAGWKSRLDPTLYGNRAEVVEVLQAIVAGLDLAIERDRAEAER